MTEFRIELTFRDPPSRTWVSRVLFTAVAHGIRCNRGQYESTYRVIPSDLDEMIVGTADGDLDRTDVLAEAVEAYVAFDPDDTELQVTATYTGGNTDFPCSIGLSPRADGYALTVDTDWKQLQSKRRLASFLALSTALFERFEFVYGASRLGEEAVVPQTRPAARVDHPRLVTYYPSWLVDERGRERVRTAPAETVQELSTGGVVICLSRSAPQSSWGDQLRAVQNHLDGASAPSG